MGKQRQKNCGNHPHSRSYAKGLCYHCYKAAWREKERAKKLAAKLEETDNN